MNPPVVVGVDPGARDTGIVIRWKNTVVAQLIVHRAEDESPEHGIGPIYLTAIRDGVREMHQQVIPTAAGRAYGVLVAVEQVSVPKTHIGGRLKLISPKDPMALSMAFGAAVTAVDDAVVVPLGGNGYGALSSYPEDLVSAAERRFGLDREAPQSSKLRHLRSAWDVAYRGMEAARKGVPA